MAAIGTRKLKLNIDGDDVTCEVSAAVITSKETESDFVSFCDAAAGGGREYGLKLTFVQDAAAASLWDKVWTAAGTDVEAVVMPYGNATPTATEPHFEGTVTIIEPDGDLLGGEADASGSARFVTEVEWVYNAKPVRVVA